MDELQKFLLNIFNNQHNGSSEVNTSISEVTYEAEYQGFQRADIDKALLEFVRLGVIQQNQLNQDSYGIISVNLNRYL